MSEEKPSATIIKGPWKKRSSGPTEEELIIVDQLAMTDEIVNECSMAYLELLAKNGVDIGDSTLDMLNKDFDSAAVGFSSDGTLQLPDLHGDEDLLKAVRALVANEPELSSQVVKAWLTEDD